MINTGVLFSPGVPVRVLKLLPMDATAPASDIQTREEQRFPTGEKIHCMEMNRQLYVSQEFFDKLKAYKPNGASKFIDQR